MLRLSCYFRHNIVPTLVLEILGDLKKDFEGKGTSSERVIGFAKKLFPVSAVVNKHYRAIMKDELCGVNVPLDGRPYLDVKKTVA